MDFFYKFDGSLPNGRMNAYNELHISKYMEGEISKYVLTGGPGVGKTSVLNVLGQRGYNIVPEAARQIITKAQEEKTDCLSWKNNQGFQDAVMNLQLNLERTVTGDAFCDRGIIDVHAYSLLKGSDAPYQLEDLGRGRYKGVFILDPLENYCKDSERRENPEYVREIHEAIGRSYGQFGYSSIKVPLMSIEERVNFILNEINSQKMRRNGE